MRLLTWLFFQEIEVAGQENIPTNSGGLLVSWHPNGLVDPCLILTHAPRRVVFGARHGLFRWPVLGTLLRQAGTVPILRAQDLPADDEEARRLANRRSLDRLASEVANGRLTALFPEGVSHDEPRPVELKSGAARLYYRARQLAAPGQPLPAIVPVGLHYDGKRLFRSRALVEFHPPIDLPEALNITPAEDEGDEAGRERCRKLTDEIEHILPEIIHATDDWHTHHLLQRGRKILRAERAHRAGADPGRPAIAERVLGFARLWKGYHHWLDTNPEAVDSLMERVETYDRDLHDLHLDDHDLDRDPPLVSPWLAVLLLLQLVTLLLLFPPVLMVGYVVNAPPMLAVTGLAWLFSKKHKDEATVKLCAGVLAFPMAWVGAGLLAALANTQLHRQFEAIPDRPVLAGALVFGLSIIGGDLALRHQRMMRETARSVRVRLVRRWRRRCLERLRAERAALHDVITGMAEGLELPGQLASDGTIRSS